MSYPGNLTHRQKKRWDTAIKTPIKAGTIYKGKYKILEDCTAHSCPYVIEIDENGNEIGEKFPMTIYLHNQFGNEEGRKRKD